MDWDESAQTLRGATQFQTQSASLWPFLCGRGEPRLSPGPLLALSWAAPSPAALSTKGPLSVGGCFAYSCAVIAVDGGILTRNEKKVKGIRAKSDFNTVDYKLKAEETGGHGGPPLQERSKTRRRGNSYRGRPKAAPTVGDVDILPHGPAMIPVGADIIRPPLTDQVSRADDIRPYTGCIKCL